MNPLLGKDNLVLTDGKKKASLLFCLPFLKETIREVKKVNIIKKKPLVDIKKMIKEESKHTCYKKSSINKMAIVSIYISIITLSIKELNSIETHKIAEWTKKKKMSRNMLPTRELL